MFVVWHKEKKKYVGKKLRGWPRPRILVDKLQDAQVYKSKAAIKNSIGIWKKNESRNPKDFSKPFGHYELPEWAEIMEIRLNIKEE